MNFLKPVIILAGICLLQSCSQPAAEHAAKNPPTDILIPVAQPVAFQVPATLFPFVDWEGNGKWGFKNRKDKWIIHGKFDLAGNFSNGFAPVIEGNVHGFCDREGKVVAQLPAGILFGTFNHELSGETFFIGEGEGSMVVVSESEEYGYANFAGEVFIPCQFEMAHSFSEERAHVMKNGKTGFIDPQGKMVIAAQFEAALSFSQGTAPVRLNNKWGYINQIGEWTIKPGYKYAEPFYEGFARVTFNEDYSDWFFIDKTGKTVIAGPFEAATSFKDGIAVVMIQSKCYEINKKGKIIREIEDNYFDGC